MIESIFPWLASLVLGVIAKTWYWGIVFFMAVESSFIPFPSEIVVPPAAYLAQQGEMNIVLVVLAGTFGSLIGALFNYFLAYTFGRKIIYSLAGHRAAGFLLLNQEKVAKAEKYFLKYGNFSTFFGRFVPAIRQLISIPAGFSKMNLKNFIFFTTLGSGLWVAILAVLGYAFGSNQELLSNYYQEISLVFGLLAVGLLIVLVGRNYLRRLNLRKKERKSNE